MSLAAFDPDAFLAARAAPAPVVPENRIPQPWRAGLDILSERDRPRGAGEARWDEMVRDAHAFAWTWGADALAAGWTISNVFGFDLDETYYRIGLVLALRSGSVIRVEEDRVRILFPDRVVHVRRCDTPDDAQPIWAFRGRI